MATKEDLQERAQLVRVHEANCHIEHPTPNELRFREAIMKDIAVKFGLRCLREREWAAPAVAGKGGAK